MTQDSTKKRAASKKRGGPGAAKPKTKARSSVKKAIFKAAMDQFLVKGYDAATTNDICLAAGITKPTLYYYAQNKRHLFYLLHMETIEDTLRPHMEMVSAITDPALRLTMMIRGFTEMLCKHPELRVLIHETLGMRDRYFQVVRQTWKQHYLLLRDTIGELQATKTIKNTSKPAVLALLILGMVTWTTFWFDYERGEGIDEVADIAVDFVFRGLSEKE